jgi:sugar fermentation stimulation protein A
MQFDRPLITGTLIRRVNRFVADIKLRNGHTVQAHCTNTGSLKTCCTPGWEVALSKAANPKRKLKYTWELVHNGTCWIGINTLVPNRIAEEAVRGGRIPELDSYSTVMREKPYGENSRIDLLLTGGAADCYVEIKNVTMIGNDGAACFPDAVTTRGLKHLRELQHVVWNGQRAVMLYVIQRSDTTVFRPADSIDPDYAAELRRAVKNGVEALAYRADVSLDGIVIGDPVRVVL